MDPFHPPPILPRNINSISPYTVTSQQVKTNRTETNEGIRPVSKHVMDVGNRVLVITHGQQGVHMFTLQPPVGIRN